MLLKTHLTFLAIDRKDKGDVVDKDKDKDEDEDEDKENEKDIRGDLVTYC